MRLKNAGDPDFDPELEKAKLEAVKIEYLVYWSLCLIKDLNTEARQAYLVYRMKNTQNLLPDRENEKWKELSGKATSEAVKAYRSMAGLMPVLDGILKVYGERFETQDRDDYASISLVLTEVAKNFGQRKWWCIFSKALSDEEFSELGSYLLLKTIESGYVYGDMIPMEKRQKHIRVFLGLETANIPASCPIHPAGT